MKFGIDGSSITPSKAGIGYYIFSLIQALQELDKENEYYIFTNDIKNLVDLNLVNNFKAVEIKADRVSFSWIVKVVNYLNNNNFDSFLSTANFSFGILYNKSVQIVHDLAPIKYPQFFSKKGALNFKVQFNLCLKRCKKILTISESIKNEVIEYMPSTKDKIDSAGFGIHDWVSKKSTLEELERVKEQYNLPEKYFVSVSTLEPRKNHINTIKAFAKFHNDYPDFHYVIVGKKGWFYDEILKEVETSVAKDNIHLLGYLPEEDLGALYDLSKGVIMLSFYEGIGLSALEGTFRGLPVLVSDIPVFREVVKENGVFKDPKNIDDILSGLKTLSISSRKDFENHSIFSWLTSAKIVQESLSKSKL